MDFTISYPPHKRTLHTPSKLEGGERKKHHEKHWVTFSNGSSDCRGDAPGGCSGGFHAAESGGSTARAALAEARRSHRPVPEFDRGSKGTVHFGVAGYARGRAAHSRAVEAGSPANVSGGPGERHRRHPSTERERGRSRRALVGNAPRRIRQN